MAHRRREARGSANARGASGISSPRATIRRTAQRRLLPPPSRRSTTVGCTLAAVWSGAWCYPHLAEQHAEIAVGAEREKQRDQAADEPAPGPARGAGHARLRVGQACRGHGDRRGRAGLSRGLDHGPFDGGGPGVADEDPDPAHVAGIGGYVARKLIGARGLQEFRLDADEVVASAIVRRHIRGLNARRKKRRQRQHKLNHHRSFLQTPGHATGRGGDASLPARNSTIPPSRPPPMQVRPVDRCHDPPAAGRLHPFRPRAGPRGPRP